MLKTGSLDNGIQDFFIGSAIMVYEQYTIIYKYGMRLCQLDKKNFPQETMAADKNRFTPELSEKEVIELLEKATPGSTNKVKYGMKIFEGKNLKTLF